MSFAKKRASRWWVWQFTIVLWPIVADIQIWVPWRCSAQETAGEDPPPAASTSMDGRFTPLVNNLLKTSIFVPSVRYWKHSAILLNFWGPYHHLGEGPPTMDWRPTVGANARKIGAHSTNGIVGHLSSAKGCQPWRPIMLCNGSGQEGYNDARSGTCCPFILAKKHWGIHAGKG